MADFLKSERYFYRSEFFHKDYPRLQILTLEELFGGKEVQIPMNLTTFKQAERILKETDQGALF